MDTSKWPEGTTLKTFTITESRLTFLADLKAALAPLIEMGLSNLSDEMSEAFKRGMSIGLANSTTKTPTFDSHHVNHSNVDHEQTMVDIRDAPSYDRRFSSSTRASALLALEYGDDNPGEAPAASGSQETDWTSEVYDKLDPGASPNLKSSNRPSQRTARSQSPAHGAHDAKIDEGRNEAFPSSPELEDHITRKEAERGEMDRKDSEKQKLLRQMKDVFAARKESGSFEPLNEVVKRSEPQSDQEKNEDKKKDPEDAINSEHKHTTETPTQPVGTTDRLVIQIHIASSSLLTLLKNLGPRRLVQLANNAIHTSRNPRDQPINYRWINDVTFTEDGHLQIHIHSRKHFRKLAAETSWENALRESILALRPSYKIIMYQVLPETLGFNLSIKSQKSEAIAQLVRENSTRISTLSSPSNIRDIRFELCNDSSRQRLAITLTTQALARQTLTLGLIWNNEHHACEIPDLDPTALVRCGNCQHYGHLDFHCHFPQRCRNCAGAHPVAFCTSPTLKCALCGGPHAAAKDDCAVKQAVKQRLRDAYLRQQEDAAPPPAVPSPSPKSRPSQPTHPVRLRSSPLKPPTNPTPHPNPKAEALLTQLERVKNSIFANRAAFDESARRRIGKVVGDLRGVVLHG